jgi:uncharacterized protein
VVEAGLVATPSIDLARLARDLGLPAHRVEVTVDLLDAGNTVPFITRYRKDQTGGLDEEQVREIQARLLKLRMLADRRQTILRSIESQGKLTPALARQIEAADSTRLLEDLYLPYKPKKQTLAAQARERGLEPLAEELRTGSPAAIDLDARAADFVDPDKQLTSVADVLLGVGHILAEEFSESAEFRGRLRKIMRRSGKLVSTRTEVSEEQAKGFRDYFDYHEELSRVPPHRVLAINRGERAKLLRVRIDADLEAMQQVSDELFTSAEHPHAEFLKNCARDALSRLVLPSLEREFRRELTERAENHAVDVFAKNLRNLLLQPPVRGRRVLAIDPGFKNGCKLAAVDEFGLPLEFAVVHLVGKEQRRDEARAKLLELREKHQLSLIAVGNGTASRETEELLCELLANEWKDQGLSYVTVNEAGASVYSTSRLGREELPDCDAMQRGAVSIGRRLLDPLSELVKIDPANIGVGLYQHDVKAKHLRTSLDAVVESCVNFVGVDLNSASPALLGYVSGLNQLTARRLFEHRIEHGPFRSREQLKEVPGIGEASFVQSAGFLKITGGENPLDATWIHPETYPVVRQLLTDLGGTVEDLAEPQRLGELVQKAKESDLGEVAARLQIGTLLLGDVLAQLSRPGRDPREDLPPPVFKQGVARFEDLEAGMELSGAVLNVVDFGAFVDIGLHDSGLVHISQMANRYVKDPHEVVAVGQNVKVWVLETDKNRRRVSLTMIPPGTPRVQAEPKRQRPPRGKRPGGPPAQAGAAQAPEGGAPPAGQGGQRPPRPPRPQRPARPQRDQRRDRPPQHQRPAVVAQPRPKPKPLKPISEAMKQGREPMRTFGDLKQFIDQKDKPADEAGAGPS